MNTEKLVRIKELVLQKDHLEVKKILDQTEAKYKGALFEATLEHLYKGNGWLVNSNGGRSDAGADLLLFHPESPDKVSFVIQAKNHRSPLTVDETRVELLKFENDAQPKYRTNNFKLISVSGFVENAIELEQFTMGLYCWKEVIRLIDNFSNEAKYPSLELTAHNKITNNKINSFFKLSNKVAVIQATGTGKSYLIGQSLLDHIKNKCLVLAPSTHILNQQKNLLPWLPNVKYMTYAKAANIPDSYWDEMNFGFIVMDEFHRAGAKKWGSAIERITKFNKRTKILGTTATHIRFLDNSRNMAAELFNNVIASNLPLQDAIAKRILPNPKYVCGLYQLKETINDHKQFIFTSEAEDAVKQKSTKNLDGLLVDWESSSGVPDIFNKHLDSINGKYVVFCEDLAHLDLMIEKVRSWFRMSASKRGQNSRRYDYVVHSKLPENEVKTELQAFKEASGQKGIHLLFSINMLNEGLHIKGVNGVILLRKTVSPIIYFQQIGRCLQVASGKAPIIFDLVNNVNNVKAKAFSSTLKAAIAKEQKKRVNIGIPPQTINLHIVDETVQITKKLQRIKKQFHEKSDYFEKGFTELKKYKKHYGDCLVDNEQEINSSGELNKWVSRHQLLYSKRLLPEDKIKRLEELGFVWNKAEYQWDIGIKTLIDYKNLYGSFRGIGGSCISPSGFDLAYWIKNCKKYYSSGNMPMHRIEQLQKIGFIKQ